MIEIDRVEVTSISLDKDDRVIYCGYHGFNADGDITTERGFDLRGEEYENARQAVDDAVTAAVLELGPDDALNTFGVIEAVIEAGARRRLNLDA